MQYVNISEIHPAKYNPRKLSEEAFVDLQGSLKDLGFILPVIINKDNMTIIAGHQRTKASTKIGLKSVPCFYVSDVQLQDEMQFNLIHNGVEYEPSVNGVSNAKLEEGEFYTDIPNDQFEITESMAAVVKEMCRLILRYGDALCAIVCDGEVLFGNNYVFACQRLDIPVHVYILPKDKREKYNYYFSKKYGVYSYDAVEKPDFVQGLAQPPRVHGMEWSVLYRRVWPVLKEDSKDVNILDFGCGKAAFITKLRVKLNYKNAIGLEFFNHNRVGISVAKGHKMIDDFFKHYEKHGKFDYVICDAVINSVVSNEAEMAVMTCLNLFCKPGGKVFFSGRLRKAKENIINSKRDTADGCLLSFIEEDSGLTPNVAQGHWFFQKYLTDEQYKALPEKYGLQPFVSYTEGSYFGFGCTKIHELDVEQCRRALAYEFNLPLPNNVRYGRHHEALTIFGFEDIPDTPSDSNGNSPQGE